MNVAYDKEINYATIGGSTNGKLKPQLVYFLLTAYFSAPLLQEALIITLAGLRKQFSDNGFN